MILKIQNAFARDKGWFIMDGIKEILSDRILKSQVVPPIDRHFDSPDQAEGDPAVLQLIVTFKDGKTETWISDVATYLLNDCGKTIERL